MKILVASDSFKGSLSSEQIIRLVQQAAGRVFPEAQVEGLLVADGGEGTVEALVRQLGGRLRTRTVCGPLGAPVEARYGLLPGGRAIVEMAQASGLPLLRAEERDPLRATSFGTGELIRDALDQGVRDLTVAIGGSATNDGGMGALAALGVRFLDPEGRELPGCGGQLGRVCRVDCSGLHPAAAGARFTVLCDVTNLLLGPAGASYTFGPQKGADEAALRLLEAGMTHYAGVVERETGVCAAAVPGAGAAGGLGFGLMTLLQARLRPGVETVLDLLDFDARLAGTDLVITGEGRMDGQSSCGKLPAGVGDRCKRAGVPAVAIVGGLLEGYEEIYRHGIQSVVTTICGAMPLQEAIDRAEPLYADAAFRLLSAVRCGMQMQNPRPD